MFSVEMLPARQGDCLWIEYGEEDAPRFVLIDGGMGETAEAIRQKIEDRNATRLELIVVTHIDNDHILGIIEFLKDKDLDIEIGDIWFNGRPQLEAAFAHKDVLGTPQGDALSQLLEKRKLPWNEAFGRNFVERGAGKPRKVPLAGGLTITVIGPPRERLNALAEAWLNVRSGDERVETKTEANQDVLGKTDVWPAKWKDVVKFDKAVANGSSIALIAEYDGKCLLLTGDAFASDLVSGLDDYRAHFGEPGAPLDFAAVKLSHHGSAYNISKPFMERLRCNAFLVSTDGAQHKHPDTQALLSVVRWSQERPKLLFNYRTPQTTWWLDEKNKLAEEFRNYDAEASDDYGWFRLDL